MTNTKTDGERLVTPQYLAGSIDCDGCISIVKMKNTGTGRSLRYEVRVKMTNTHLPFLLILQNQYGGHLKTLSRGGKNQPNWKPAYDLCWGTKNSEDVLRAILPYLIIKKERAEVALKLREDLIYKGSSKSRLSEAVLEYRDSLYERLKVLNRRGVVV